MWNVPNVLNVLNALTSKGKKFLPVKTNEQKVEDLPLAIFSYQYGSTGLA